jgi:hypothetical protein
MSIEDKIADLLKESEALQMAEACKTNTKIKESDDEDEDDEDDLEESEQLDELSKKTLGSYVKKASGEASFASKLAGAAGAGEYSKDAIAKEKQHSDLAKKRKAGINTAVNKLTKEDLEGFSVEELEDFMMSEDYEQLDELSKKTLGSYVKKASNKLMTHGTNAMTSVARNDFANADYHSKGIVKRKAGINTAVNKLTKEDIDADVDALMNGENLTEEFREKATAIFEAAVMSRVTQEVETLEEEFQERLVEYYEGAKEEIVEKVDGYLNYVVEQWMNDNELAVTTGIKNDILEGFVSGMKNLFQEHYIEVPDEKLDLVAELQESVAKLESKLDESLESNVTMSKYINYVERNTITEEFCKSMTDTEVEKFKSLAEELSFEDTDTYSSKLQIIKENYFGKKSTAGKVGSIVTDSPVQLTESVQNIDPNVAQYLETFNRIKI